MPAKKSKTTQPLPVSFYVYKWLRYRHGYKKVLEVNQPITITRYSNGDFVERYFNNEAKRPTILISSYYVEKEKLYIFAQCLESWFNQDMLSYIQLSVRIGIPARTALNHFLKLYRIEEDDLARDTAYKRWQRMGKVGLPGIRVN